MDAPADSILRNLQSVERHREHRKLDPGLAARVAAIKGFQHARFQRTYADLLASPRYRAAALFFLDELYGPADYSSRDAQFARVVPIMVRLLPAETTHTVRVLSDLHASAEKLDTAMATRVDDLPLRPRSYVLAWRGVGHRGERASQIDMLHDVGSALDAYTVRPMLRRTLRAMKIPARAAGLGALQRFLERGFETFRRMGGADAFLDTIVQRERALARALFDGPIEEAEVMLLASHE